MTLWTGTEQKDKCGCWAFERESPMDSECDLLRKSREQGYWGAQLFYTNQAAITWQEPDPNNPNAKQG